MKVRINPNRTRVEAQNPGVEVGNNSITDIDGGTPSSRLDEIQTRGGTAAEWTSSNPVLASREMGLETDTNLFKFGDGATAWVDLDYATDRSLTTNRQTASYTLVLDDEGKLVEMNVAIANTVTLPPNSSVAFAIGSTILLSQYGAGQTSVAAGAGVTIRSAGGALALSARYAGASLVKIAANEWYLQGQIGPLPPSSAFDDIKGWWRADTFSGSTPNVILTDKSLNGNNMTQQAGILTAGTAANGQAKFTGNATARLTSPLTLKNWPVTIITLGKRANNATCGLFGHIGAAGYGTLWYGHEASNSHVIYNLNGTDNLDSNGGSDTCWTARIGCGSRVSMINGLIQSDMPLASIVQSGLVATTIGTEYRGLNIDWYETLVWDRVLTLAELDEVNSYINTRYSMSLPLWSSYTEAKTLCFHGQSNMGRGPRGTLNANVPVGYRGVLSGLQIWYGAPSSNIGTAFSAYDIDTERQTLGDGQSGYIGPDTACAKDYVDRIGGTVYINKYFTGSTSLAYSGSNNGYWTPTDNTLEHSNSKRKYAGAMVNWWKSLRVHQIASRKPSIKGYIWYQGEDDAVLQADALAYNGNGQTFFSLVKREMGYTSFPVFLCRISSHIDIVSQPYRDTVRSEQDALVAVIGATEMDTDSYTVYDSAHINAAGQITLGQTIAPLL